MKPTLSQLQGGVARTFETVDALSAFLLAPILSGPPGEVADRSTRSP
jgi:hypothetical protein